MLIFFSMVLFVGRILQKNDKSVVILYLSGVAQKW